VANRVAQVERFEYGGAVLVDEILGSPVGRHLVFLHGWGVNRESLRGVAVLFTHTHQVHLVDLPGFGEAPLPPGTWSTVNYADLVQQFILDRLQGSVVVIGHSFGGRVAIRLASRRLASLKGIVLMGVPGLPRPPQSKQALRLQWIRGLRKVLVALKPVLGTRLIDWHSRTYASRDILNAGDMRAVFVRVVSEDLTESAVIIACPVLLLYGTDDRETPPWLGVRYRELMGERAALVLLPHKDHFLYEGTGAHLIAQKIRDWLSEPADV
jgi:pimeloyl-ACP methyl ester carboxylesterase